MTELKKMPSISELTEAVVVAKKIKLLQSKITRLKGKSYKVKLYCEEADINYNERNIELSFSNIEMKKLLGEMVDQEKLKLAKLGYEL